MPLFSGCYPQTSMYTIFTDRTHISSTPDGQKLAYTYMDCVGMGRPKADSPKTCPTIPTRPLALLGPFL